MILFAWWSYPIRSIEEKEYLSKSINLGGNELKKGKKRHKLCWVLVPKIRENNWSTTNSNRRYLADKLGRRCRGGLACFLSCADVDCIERWPGTIVRANRWEFCPASRGAVGDSSAICCTMWILSFAFGGSCIQIAIVKRHGNQNGSKIGISARRAIQGQKSSPLLALTGDWRCR